MFYVILVYYALNIWN